jgi:hypothetical protein
MAKPRNAPDFFEIFRPPKAPAPEKAEEQAQVPAAPAEQGVPKPEETPVSPEPAAQEAAEPQAVPEPPPVEPQAPAARPIMTAQGKVIITLSQEAFGAVLVVIILLIALAFAGGHWRGTHATKEAQAVPPVTPAPTKPVAAHPAPAKKVRDTGIVRREVTPSTLTRTTEGKVAARTAIPPAPRAAPTPTVAPPGPPEPTASYWALQVISGINLNKAEELRAALEKQGYPNVLVRREGRYASVRLGRFESKDSSEALQFKKNISEMKYEGRTQFSGCYFVKVE